MRLRYTKRAIQQNDGVLAYLQERSPQGADSLRRRIETITALLRQHPYAGHSTSRAGVLRMGVLPYPYVSDYRVTGEAIIIQRFRHAARRPVP